MDGNKAMSVPSRKPNKSKEPKVDRNMTGSRNREEAWCLEPSE
jgi:hypothetical protein